MRYLDRPISSPDEDEFDRAEFVLRLTQMLVIHTRESDNEQAQSSGQVIGLAGEWGSGKSSILNLVEHQLVSEFESIIVLRFDPWIVSGRDDLIRRFFEDLLAQIQQSNPSLSDEVADLANALKKYESLLGVGIDFLPLPKPLLDLLKVGVHSVANLDDGPQNLHQAKKQIENKIEDLQIPIVVLIDEVDRVDDREIGVLVQLVKAVADFPGISYLLAYDANRVIQALGASAPAGQSTERGRSYLEKIVQTQIQIPASFEFEVIDSLEKELEERRENLKLPPKYRNDERYWELKQILFPTIIRTPRDTKRLLDTFSSVRALSGDEINWVDTLGYSALVAKAPEIADKVAKDPIFFTFEFDSQGVFVSRYGMDRPPIESELRTVLGDDWNQRNELKLVKFLFGRLNKKDEIGGRSARYNSDEPTQISWHRSLSILIRHGMPPGLWSRSSVFDLVNRDPDHIADAIRNAAMTGTFLDLKRFIQARPDELAKIDLVSFWIGVSRALRKPDESPPKNLDYRWSLAHDLRRIFDITLESNAALQGSLFELIEELRNTDDREILSWVLWNQADAHGISERNYSGSGRRRPIGRKREIAKIVKDVSENFISKHMEGDWIFGNWTASPLFWLLTIGKWDRDSKSRLQEITIHRSAFVGFVMMMFSSDHITGLDTLEELIGWDVFADRLTKSIWSKEHDLFSDDIKYSLERARDKFNLDNPDE